jgi:hypothetical protein
MASTLGRTACSGRAQQRQEVAIKQDDPHPAASEPADEVERSRVQAVRERVVNQEQGDLDEVRGADPCLSPIAQSRGVQRERNPELRADVLK